MLQKECTKCHQIKDVAEYHKQKLGKYGVRAVCRECQKQIARDYNQTEHAKELNRKALRQRYYSDKHQAYRAEYMKSDAYRESQQKFNRSEKARAKTKRQRQKYPERTRARDAIQNAIREGRFPKVENFACVHCGNPAQEFHHYLGYDESHWFDVCPLCKPCHVLTVHHPDQFAYLDSIDPSTLPHPTRPAQSTRKLTETDVVSIRSAHAYGVRVGVLAKQYGVHHAQISMIVSRKRWKQVV
jgi:hypothetical protein